MRAGAEPSMLALVTAEPAACACGQPAEMTAQVRSGHGDHYAVFCAWHVLGLERVDPPDASFEGGEWRVDSATRAWLLAYDATAAAHLVDREVSLDVVGWWVGRLLDDLAARSPELRVARREAAVAALLGGEASWGPLHPSRLKKWFEVLLGRPLDDEALNRVLLREPLQ